MWTIESKENGHSLLPAFAPYKGNLPKKVAVGMISHRRLQVETPEDVAADIRTALEYIDEDKLVLSSDCGFGRQGVPRPIATYKAAALAQGANIVRGELGAEQTRVRAAEPESPGRRAGRGDRHGVSAGSSRNTRGALRGLSAFRDDVRRCCRPAQRAGGAFRRGAAAARAGRPAPARSSGARKSSSILRASVRRRPSAFVPSGGQADDVPAAVVRVAAALDEPLLLELVEQPDELPAVVAERVGDRALRLARALVEHEQDRVVVRVQPRLLVGGHRLLLRAEAEALEQERRGGEQLVGQPRVHARGDACRGSGRSSGKSVAPTIVVLL